MGRTLHRKYPCLEFLLCHSKKLPTVVFSDIAHTLRVIREYRLRLVLMLEGLDPVDVMPIPPRDAVALGMCIDLPFRRIEAQISMLHAQLFISDQSHLMLPRFLPTFRCPRFWHHEWCTPSPCLVNTNSCLLSCSLICCASSLPRILYFTGCAL